MQSNHTVRREEAVRQLRDYRSIRAAVFSVKIKPDRLYHVSVQTTWDVNNYLSVDPRGQRHRSSVLHLDAANIFPRRLYDHLEVFQQLRINGVTARYVPYASHDAMSDYKFAVCDGGSPKAVVRRFDQSAKLLWIPTELCDYIWHSFADEHEFCSISVTSAGYHRADPLTQHPCENRNISTSGHFIIDVSATLRGRNHFDPGQRGSGSGATLPTLACDCSKCVRVFEPAADAEVYPQTQILFDQEDLVETPTLYGIYTTRSRASAVRQPSSGEEGGVH